MPLISTKERFCRPEPVPGFPTLCVVVFILVSDLEVLVSLLILMILLTIMAERLSFYNHISHRIVKYKKYYWLYIFMVCKLQHGKIERIWYLQIKKACQVVECAFLDWCNLIRMKITTKYKIRTKYNDNLNPNNYKDSRKTTSLSTLYSSGLKVKNVNIIQKWLKG